MTWTLGISAYYHDSAVALVHDGQIVAAASEERFSRKKHDASFPAAALQSCLETASISINDLDYVGYYEKSLLKFDRLLETYLAHAPRGYRSFAAAVPSWLQTKLHVPREIRRQLGGQYRKRVVFAEHHQSHAASAFYPSPFDEAAILTIDGVGEWATTSWGIGRGNHIDLQQQIHFPHSLGLLYSALTYFCGFRVNSGEYKLMGLAPYGSPQYVDLIRRHLIQINDDGSYRLNMRYFCYGYRLRMTDRAMERLFGCQRRRPEEPIRQIDMDLAASIQQVVEEAVLKLAAHVHRRTQMRRLCMAGGVALNCVANGRLLREGPFEELWIQPAAGDAGGALGVALWIQYQLLGRQRTAVSPDAQSGSLLGNAIDSVDELKALAQSGAVMHHYEDEDELALAVAKLLAGGKVVGLARGRMEFGPRALGNRSILGDPRDPEMQTKMNLKIKYRESFRPFAPAVLDDRAADCFDLPRGTVSPYMLLVFDVAKHRRRQVDVDEGLTGLDRVRQQRSDLPAITHLDGSARVQTVSEEQHPGFHRILKAFEDLTGCPVLINTSFNVRGEPIVCTASDAYRCFLATQMDALVIGQNVFLRDEQPAAQHAQSQAYRHDLEPD